MKWQYVTAPCEYENLPASSCTFSGGDVLLFRISGKFDVGLCVTVLNFQSNPKSNDFTNAIIPQKLHVPCCSFTSIFLYHNFRQVLS